jgi:capsular polysaccharide biosynthesis protein
VGVQAIGEGDRLNLKAYLAAVRRYWLTFVLTTGVIFTLGLTWLLLSPAKFVSSTQLMVSIEGFTTAAAYENDQVVERRINSYIPLLTSGVVTQRVIDKLNLPLTSAELADRINATNVPPRTSIIDVQVTDASPARAQLLADTLATEFVNYVEALETPTGSDSQKVRTTVVTPASEAREQRVERILLGAVAGLAAVVVGAVAAWIRSRTDPIVRTAEQAAVVGVPVLGCVTAASEASNDDLGAYRGLRTRLRSVMNSTNNDDRGRVLMLVSAAGELDTASVASNLGRVMEFASSRSIVLDVAIPQSDVAFHEPRVRTVSCNHSDPGVAVGADAGATNKTDDNPGFCVDVSNPTDDPAGPKRRAAEGFPDTLSLSEWAAEPDQAATTDAAELINRLRSDYEQVIVAAPPVLSTVAASTMAGYADGVVLVLSTVKTRRRDLARAAGDLRATGAPLIGTVLIGKDDNGATGGEANSGRLRMRSIKVGAIGSLSVAMAVGAFNFLANRRPPRLRGR